MSGPSTAHDRAALLREQQKRRGAEADFGAENPVLRVREPRSGRIDELDLRWARDLPLLRADIAKALSRICDGRPGRSAVSNDHLIAHLRSGLGAFLNATGRTGIGPSALGRDLFTTFLRWLDQKSDTDRSRSAQYKINLWTAANTLVTAMRALPGSAVPSEQLPVPIWKAGRSTGHGRDATTMEEDDVRRIVQVCAAIVRETSEKVERGLRALSEDDQETEALRLLDRVPVTRRSSARLKKSDPELFRRLRAYGLAEARLVLAPRHGDLLPFLVLLAYAFRLNDSVIRGARLDDFRNVPSFAGTRIVATPYKKRKHGRVHSSVPAIGTDAVNPSRMLSLLERWLDPMRRDIGTDLLFAACSLTTPEVLTLETEKGKRLLKHLIRFFATRHGLPPFSVTKLRAHRIDQAHRLTGGDPMAMMVAASHDGLQTSRDHYTTRAARLREDENLALGLRRLQAGFVGTAPPAAELPNPTAHDAGITPGWRCGRPGASPFHPPRPDGLCVAYARCPVCEHGSLESKSVESARLAQALARALDRALLHMAAEAWLARLSHIAAHMADHVLPDFPPETIAQAAELPPITLPTPD